MDFPKFITVLKIQYDHILSQFNLFHAIIPYLSMNHLNIIAIYA